MADEEYRVQYAKSLRRPVSDLDALIARVHAEPHDSLPRRVLADYLEDNGLHADEAALHHLRSGDTNGYVVHADGKVHAGPNLSIDDIRDRMTAAGSHWWDRDAMRFFGTRLSRKAYSGPAGTFFVTSEQPPDDERGYSVRWYRPQENSIDTVGRLAHWNQSGAHTIAKEFAARTEEDLLRDIARNNVGNKRWQYRHYLESRDRHADDETLNVLSTHHGPISIEDTPDGKVRVRPRIGE